MGSVLLVGGVGYLGYNLAKEHKARGDSVYIVARKSSSEKRSQLFSELSALADKSVLLNNLVEASSIRNTIDGIGCPSITYLLTGRLQGTFKEMREAHVTVPLAWARVLAQRCKDTLVVYVSSVASVGDPSACSDGVSVAEEKNHLEGCLPLSAYSRTKAEGEKEIIRLCREGDARAAVLRPGLLVGEWSYHKEWRLMYRLAKLRLRLRGGPYLHAVAAKDLAKASVIIDESLRKPCNWFYATPWRTRLGSLHEIILQGLGVKNALPLPFPSRIPASGVMKDFLVQQRYSFEPRLLNELGMEWTPLEYAVNEAVEWMKTHWGRKIASNKRRVSARTHVVLV
ncbi:hypothetical protein PYJP_20260 [Pyrofollis japonicus]|uniref:NAD-dependent epimerase/dehydratase family protein n=1 Tax=Pyrofollis japonicus TaxID=3060460 RepID=UPI00295AA930|nr:NAD-dependent epimerase/dehydratase family protein [Pyrofollis japonicus]BEP18674.1 hypothetical protein PYJP_20260 [Pyrofollis japonicus]